MKSIGNNKKLLVSEKNLIFQKKERISNTDIEINIMRSLSKKFRKSFDTYEQVI